MSTTLVTLALGMDRVSLSVPADPAFREALRLVVGGIGSRLELAYEQVNELQLAVEALVSHRTTVGPTIVVDAELEDRSAALIVGPFTPEADAGGRRVSERLVQRTRVVRRADDAEWIELVVGDLAPEPES